MENQIYRGVIFVNKKDSYQINSLYYDNTNEWILTKNITEKASRNYLCIYPYNLKQIDYLKKQYTDCMCIPVMYRLGKTLNTLQNDKEQVKRYIGNNNNLGEIKKYYDSYVSNVDMTNYLNIQKSKLQDNISFVYVFKPDCVALDNNLEKPFTYVQNYLRKCIENTPIYKEYIYLIIYGVPIIAFIVGFVFGKLS